MRQDQGTDRYVRQDQGTDISVRQDQGTYLGSDITDRHRAVLAGQEQKSRTSLHWAQLPLT